MVADGTEQSFINRRGGHWKRTLSGNDTKARNNKTRLASYYRGGPLATAKESSGRIAQTDTNSLPEKRIKSNRGCRDYFHPKHRDGISHEVLSICARKYVTVCICR